MTLFEEFLLREKLSKSLADAEVLKARADASLARIAALEAPAEALFAEALGYTVALRPRSQSRGGTRCSVNFSPLLDKAEKLSGVTLPAGSAFHMLRHSHAHVEASLRQRRYRRPRRVGLMEVPQRRQPLRTPGSVGWVEEVRPLSNGIRAKGGQ
jgi:hypothetical protein